jgi:hypothetical protein
VTALFTIDYLTMGTFHAECHLCTWTCTSTLADATTQAIQHVTGHP